MSNRSRRRRPLAHLCDEGAEHSLERWCLEEAIKLGNWAECGLEAEYVRGHLAGFWKIMRCGCTFVVVVCES